MQITMTPPPSQVAPDAHVGDDWQIARQRGPRRRWRHATSGRMDRWCRRVAHDPAINELGQVLYMPTITDLVTKSRSELVAVCKEHRIKGYSRMTKPDMVEAISASVQK